MIHSDIQAVFAWWYTFFILGVGFLPVSFLLFDKFFDKGYIFSKVIGAAVVTYLIFILGIFHIFSFTTGNAYITTLAAIILFFFLSRQRSKILPAIKKRWGFFIFEEALFFVALFVWAYIHSFAPDIHGLEKYMDFGFINSILRSPYFPPKDMWFTPFTINYYYFGHLVTAVLIRLSGVPANIAFNLMLSSIFAFCFTQTFSLGANLYSLFRNHEGVSKKLLIFSGSLSGLLVAFAGNLHILYAFFTPYQGESPSPFWQLKFAPTTFPNSYWYPNATRFIYHTIHEFPIYSWVVADLHGHVLDIPFVLLTIAILFAVFMKGKKDIGNWKLEAGNFILIGFLLAIMYMTNAWDGIIYFLLTGLIFCYLYWEKLPNYRKLPNGKKPGFLRIPRFMYIWSQDLILSCLIVFFSLIVFSLPYNFYFKPFASGIGILQAPSFLLKNTSPGVTFDNRNIILSSTLGS